jgi:RHS repeat-associated protein
VEKLRKKNSVTMTYDGRSFLAGGWKPLPGGTPGYGNGVQPLYSSDGTLYLLRQIESGFALNMFDNHVFYFAGRPVATFETGSYGADAWKYLVTDHLGAPTMAIDDSGVTVWSGGFEPFGRDYQAGTANGALENDVFLRLPGQWDDELWGPETILAPVYYNVHRWYEMGTGRYSRTDPFRPVSMIDYLYARSNPGRWIDPMGLFAKPPSYPRGAIPCSQLDKPDPGCCSWQKGGAYLADFRQQMQYYCNNKQLPQKTAPDGSVDTAGYDEDPSVIGGNVPYPWYRDQGDNCVNWCTCAHERDHNLQFTVPGPEPGLSLGDQLTPNGRECGALKVSVLCLAASTTAAQVGGGF